MSKYMLKSMGERMLPCRNSVLVDACFSKRCVSFASLDIVSMNLVMVLGVLMCMSLLMSLYIFTVSNMSSL